MGGKYCQLDPFSVFFTIGNSTCQLGGVSIFVWQARDWKAALQLQSAKNTDQTPIDGKKLVVVMDAQLKGDVA